MQSHIWRLVVYRIFDDILLNQSRDHRKEIMLVGRTFLPFPHNVVRLPIESLKL